jgi:hypothetical protein
VLSRLVIPGVLHSGGSGGLKNTRNTKRMQRFIRFRPIDALRPAVDDPYIQEHPKLGEGVTTECIGGRERFGRGLARC